MVGPKLAFDAVVRTKNLCTRSWGGDFFYAVLVLTAGLLIGHWFVESGIVKRFYFYQEKFAPAAMMVCGHGFVQPVPEPESLTAYLELKQQTFDCVDIPEGRKVIPPDTFQAVHQYLLVAVAGVWSLSGISWSALNWLYGLALGLTGLAAYALCRTAMGRPLSLLCASLMMITPLQLFNLPHLRDYIKAPFFLGVIALLSWQLCAGRFSRGWVALAASAGALIGVGMGFRIDIVMLVPLYLLSIFAFSPGKFTTNLGWKGLSCLAFLTSLIVCALPILAGLKSGSNIYHVLVLGLMGEFDAKLGLTPSFYSLGYHYLDMYASTLLNAYAGLNGYSGGVIGYPSLQYEQLGAKYYLDVFQTFPADIAARFFGAAWQILHLPITAFVTFEDLYFFYDDFINPVLFAFTHNWVWDYVVMVIFSAAMVIILRRSLKLGIATLVILLFLTGYPFLQFSIRHYFYLQIVGLWLAGLVAQTLIDKVANVGVACHDDFTKSYTNWKLVLIQFVGLCIILPGVLLVGLREYQSNHVLQLFERYEAAPSESLSIERININGVTKIIPTKLFPALIEVGTGAEQVRSEFLVAEFDSRQCGRDSVHVKYVYEFDSPVYDFSRRTSLGIDNKTRVVLPVFYRDGHLRFNGIEMPTSDSACLTGLRRITEPEKLKLPLMVMFSSRWREQARYREFFGH